MLSTEKDCGDRICFLTLKVQENCLIYTKSETHPLCNVPCDIRDCAVEILHNVMCPSWFCTIKPTPAPTPGPNSWCATPSCIAGASATGIFGLLAVFLLVLLWRKTSLSNRLRARLSFYERIDEPSSTIFRHRTSTTRMNERSRASWSISNPNVVAFDPIPLNEPGEAESSV